MFQDPRINGYPDSFHAVLRRPDLSRSEWQSLLDDFSVTSALVTFPSVNPRGALFNPSLWALVYRANDGLVFVRRPLPENLSEIPLTFVYSLAGGLVAKPLAEPPAGARTSLCEWHHRVGDYHRLAGDARAALHHYEAAMEAEGAPSCGADLRVPAGILALQLGDPAKALHFLGGVVGPVARTNRGFALLGIGQPEQALVDFDGVLAGDPRNDEATFGRGLCLVALGRESEATAAFETLLARSPNHLSAPAARQQLERLRGGTGER